MTDTAPTRPALDRGRLGGDAVVGWRVEVLEEVGSTNAVVTERARAGADDGLVVVAEHQSAARGRLDRTWQAPPRSALLLSVLLRPSAAPARWSWLPLVTGLAVVRILRERGYDAGVKWPNDVLLRSAAGDEGKVAGILVERIETDLGPAAVVGIGLNVSTTTSELPVPQATSLLLHGEGTPDRTALLGDLLVGLRHEVDIWAAGGAAAVAQRASYGERCLSVGRDVRVELPAAAGLEGRAVGIDEGGRLLVRVGTDIRAVGAGDVVHARLRPPG